RLTRVTTGQYDATASGSHGGNGAGAPRAPLDPHTGVRLYFRGDDGQTNEGGASRPPSLLRTAANTDPSAADTDAKPGEAHGGGGNMHIGELSGGTGGSVRPTRHSDDNGLLGARRGENGYRIFDEAAVRRVLRIKRLIHHGLTVEEIRPMAACLDGPADEETV